MGEKRLHPSFQDKEDCPSTYAKNNSRSWYSPSHASKPCKPWWDSYASRSHEAFETSYKISGSVHVNIAAPHELVDRLLRPHVKTVDTTPTAQEVVDRVMTCCSFIQPSVAIPLDLGHIGVFVSSGV